MAAEKKTTTKKKTSSNTKKTQASKSASKPKSNTNSNKTSSKSKQEKIVKKSFLESNRQMVAWILFAVSALLLAAVLIKGEAVWLGLHNGIFGLFGICSYVWPLILIYVAIMISTNNTDRTVKGNIIGASVFVLLLSGLVHILSGNTDNGSLSDQIEQVWLIKDTVTIKSGGVIGALMGGIPHSLFGKAPAVIVLIIFEILDFVFITKTSLAGIYIFIKEWIDSRKEKKLQRESEREEEEDTEEYIPKKKRKFVPIDIGPAADDTPEDSIIIDELVGNAKKKDGKPASKQPIPFILDTSTGEVIEEKPADEPVNIDLESIIHKANKGAEKKPAPAKESKAPKEEPVQVFHTYQKPPIECLNYANNDGAMSYEEELKINAKKLVDTLNSFGVSTKIVDICRGPSVTRYELQPAAGVKISKITSLADDIALALASSGVRIEAPIPNKSAVGIEVPNKNRSTVSLREIIETPVYRNAKSKLNVSLGKDITGNTICADVAKMPHLLIAGTTGSGKSVCLNAMIISILYNSTPDEVKLLMIDPKQVEFTIYNGIPHLLVPVVADPRKAAGALGWAVTEMLQRYKMFSEKSVRDIKGYNKLAETDETMTPMPHICIFIDELSDLMMAAPNEVEDSICRLAQMARAAGMHLVIATQRPSVNVITGIIKANIPSRIALSVSSQVDSRTIIDSVGAEKLLGNGDMLFNPVGVSKPVRVQGCYVSDEEVENVVKFIKSQTEDEKKYDEDVMQEIERQAAMEPKKNSSVSTSADSDDSSGGDEMIPKAIEVVVEAQLASTTLLQRKLKLGYARAARIMDELEERQIVGPFEGSKPRKVLVSKQQWMEMNALANASAPIENPIETDEDFDYSE